MTRLLSPGLPLLLVAWLSPLSLQAAGIPVTVPEMDSSSDNSDSSRWRDAKSTRDEASTSSELQRIKESPDSDEALAERSDAEGEDGTSFRLLAGVEGVLLFRQEAGGTRTVMPTLSPRLSFRWDERFGVAVSYGFFRVTSGIGIGDVTERLHRVVVRAEYAVPVKAAAFVFALGGAASVHHASFPAPVDGDAVRDTVVVRPGIVGGVAFDVNVPISTSRSWLPGRVVLRAGVDTLWSGSRWDLITVVGASVPVGGR